MKKITSLFLSLVLLLTMVIPASAADSPDSSVSEYSSVFSDLSDADIDFVGKVVSVAEYWNYSEDGTLVLNLTKDQLKEQYGFTDAEYELLQANIVGLKTFESPEDVPMPNVFVEGATIYFDNGDIHAFLLAAATAGPAALSAALAALGTVSAGPVGTAIAAVLAVIAAPSLVEICGRVIAAAGTGRGVYIRLELDYPPISCGYW